MAGNRAEYSRVPAVKTSNAKKQAATGVPNKPEKPAAIPVTKKILELFFTFILSPTQCEKVAPI